MSDSSPTVRQRPTLVSDRQSDRGVRPVSDESDTVRSAHRVKRCQTVRRSVRQSDSPTVRQRPTASDSSLTAVQQCCHWPLFLQQHTTLTQYNTYAPQEPRCTMLSPCRGRHQMTVCDDDWIADALITRSPGPSQSLGPRLGICSGPRLGRGSGLAGSRQICI